MKLASVHGLRTIVPAIMQCIAAARKIKQLMSCCDFNKRSETALVERAGCEQPAAIDRFQWNRESTDTLRLGAG